MRNSTEDYGDRRSIRYMSLDEGIWYLATRVVIDCKTKYRCWSQRTLYLNLQEYRWFWLVLIIFKQGSNHCLDTHLAIHNSIDHGSVQNNVLLVTLGTLLTYQSCNFVFQAVSITSEVRSRRTRRPASWLYIWTEIYSLSRCSRTEMSD